MSSYLYDSMAACVKAKAHSTDVDDDGFCNLCGNEPLDEEGDPREGDVCRHGEVWYAEVESENPKCPVGTLAVDCDTCDEARYFELAKTEYGPRLKALLEKIRECLTKHGWDCSEVVDITCEDLEFSFTASREPDDIEECAVDFNAEMCLSEDYDGIRSGVTFRVDVNRVSGACITNATPENYGPECWVPRDDKAAVSERLAILENLDPESVLRLL